MQVTASHIQLHQTSTTPRARLVQALIYGVWKQNWMHLGTSSSMRRLIDYLRFYFPLKNFSLIWRRHHSWWRAAKFRPMLGAQGLWAGRNLYRATPAVTRDVGFSGLIRRTAPFSRFLRPTRGCGGSILTRILTVAKEVMIMKEKAALNAHMKLVKEECEV
jgi:hypothetical protein